jgi:cobaltochelatase CobS
MTFRLTNDQRNTARQYIGTLDAWKAHKAATGMTLSELSSSAAVWELAATLDCTDGLRAAILAAPVAAAPVAAAPVAAAPVAAAPVAAAPVAAAPAAPTADVMAAFAAMFGAVNAADFAKVKTDVALMQASVTALESRAPVQIVVNQAGQAQGKAIDGHTHKLFKTLVRMLSARDSQGYFPNVWLAGPAGSGKTKAASQAASALGLTFGFHGAMTMAHELVGFVDANGTYHKTQFVSLFESGGLCLLDELDSGSNEALLALNAALANGQMSLPNGTIIKRHADFRCVGAANTFGQGATAEYVGRTKLDAAFLSRFPGKLAWEYDLTLERALSGNTDWAYRVQNARKRAAEKGLKIMIDPRHTIAGAAYIAAGFTSDETAQLTYLSGLSDAQIKMIEGAN